jgi:hypothetical protein
MALATRLFLEIFLIRFSGSLMEKKKKSKFFQQNFTKGSNGDNIHQRFVFYHDATIS